MSFPLSSQFFHTRRPVGSVPWSTMLNESGTAPGYAIDVDDVVVGDGPETTKAYNEFTPGWMDYFPLSKVGEFVQGGLPELLNDQRVDQTGAGLAPAAFATFASLDESGGALPYPLYYPDLFVNAFYNVKTWAVNGSIGGVTISGQIVAGGSGNNSGSGTRPHSGKRTRLGAAGSFSDTLGDKSASVILTIGVGPEFPQGNLFQNPQEGAFLPVLSVTVNYSDSDDESPESGTLKTIGLNSPQADIDASSYGSEITFLGESTYSFLDSGDTFPCDVSITAAEWWAADDLWLTE